MFAANFYAQPSTSTGYQPQFEGLHQNPQNPPVVKTLDPCVVYENISSDENNNNVIASTSTSTNTSNNSTSPGALEPNVQVLQPDVSTVPTVETKKPKRSRERKRDHRGRPAYSYIALIAMAIANSKHQRCTLRDIINFIDSQFDYYKFANNRKCWTGSIRHNLTLNKCFVKLDKDPSSRGHYWGLNPSYSDMFDEGSFLRRRYRFKEGDQRKPKSEKMDKTTENIRNNLVSLTAVAQQQQQQVHHQPWFNGEWHQPAEYNNYCPPASFLNTNNNNSGYSAAGGSGYYSTDLGAPSTAGPWNNPTNYQASVVDLGPPSTAGPWNNTYIPPATAAAATAPPSTGQWNPPTTAPAPPTASWNYAQQLGGPAPHQMTWSNWYPSQGYQL